MSCEDDVNLLPLKELMCNKTLSEQLYDVFLAQKRSINIRLITALTATAVFQNS